MAIETKVGVFLCSGCGIGETLNFDRLVEVASNENKVPVYKTDNWLCSEKSIGSIKKDIEDQGLNRIVIGACSPKTHESLFELHTESGGLNRNLMEIVNLRNQCTWVHSKDKEKAKLFLKGENDAHSYDKKMGEHSCSDVGFHTRVY